MHLLLANNSAAGGGAAGAFESIASTLLSSTSSTITFSSIPQNYSSLQLRFSTGLTQNGDIRMRLNNDTSSTYYVHYLRGNGSNVQAGAAGNSGLFTGDWSFALTTADIFSVNIVDFHDYASTSKNKTLRILHGRDYNTADGVIQIASGGYYNTSAITQIDLFLGGGSFRAGSTFALYGIKGAA